MNAVRKRCAGALLWIVGIAAGASAQDADTFEVAASFAVRSGMTIEIGVGRVDDALRHADRPVLARLESGTDAMLQTRLNVPTSWRNDPHACLWARVETPGFARTVATRALADDDGEAPALKVLKGATLFGRVHAVKDAPVDAARVWMTRDGAPNLSFREARSGPDGRFCIDYFVSDTYTLHIRSRAGAVRVAGLELSTSQAPDALECKVGGGVALEGRVVDPDGHPVPGVRLVALPTGVDAFPPDAICFRTEKGGGLCADEARTDRDGHFRFWALLPGEYDLHAALTEVGPDLFGVAAELLGEQLTTVPLDRRNDPVELTFRARRIEVLVQDDRGQTPLFAPPGEGADSFLALEQRGSFERLDALFVDGLAVFGTTGDSAYVVSWTDPAVPYLEVPVDVAAGDWRTQVSMQLAPRDLRARLMVRVRDAQGAGREGTPQVQVLSRASGRTIAQGWARPDASDESTWEGDLPPGSYLVRANVFSAEPGLVSRPMFVYGEADVQLESGQQESVTLRLDPAGHLDFESLSPYVTQRRWQLGRATLGGSSATLSSAKQRRVLPLTFEVPGAFQGDLEWIVPGWSARCHTPIPPGKWILHVERDGAVDFLREVLIEDGATTVVRW